MSACEKCWSDAYLRAYGSGKSQVECYNELLEERKDNPCSPQEQAGQFWNEEKQCDRRLLTKKKD
jgi:hypothetical protein